MEVARLRHVLLCRDDAFQELDAVTHGSDLLAAFRRPGDVVLIVLKSQASVVLLAGLAVQVVVANTEPVLNQEIGWSQRNSSFRQGDSFSRISFPTFLVTGGE